MFLLRSARTNQIVFACTNDSYNTNSDRICNQLIILQLNTILEQIVLAHPVLLDYNIWST